MNKGGAPTARQKGFTLVETLIVLAVSSLLLGSAILLINGKQQTAQFQTGIFGLKQGLQAVINQAESGYYPNGGGYSCNGNLSGAGAPTFSTVTTADQGTNGSCIFLGTVLRFGGYAPASYTAYPMAANRFGTGGQIATTFTEAWPKAIAQGSTPATNMSGPQADTTTQLGYGLAMTWGSVNGGAHMPATSNSFAIALLSKLSSGVAGIAAQCAAGGAPTSGSLNSGSQQFCLYGFGNAWSPAPTSGARVVDYIDAAHTAYAPITQNVQLCFASGTTNQSGNITITSGLSISLQIFNGKVC